MNQPQEHLKHADFLAWQKKLQHFASGTDQDHHLKQQIIFSMRKGVRENLVHIQFAMNWGTYC